MSFNEEWEEVKLGDIAKYSEERIDSEKIKLENYISTSNMLPNKNGVNKAESLPKLNSATKYEKHDILISNIRPYFKKIWFSNTSGGSSNDVLVIKTKNNLIYEKYLYYYLSQGHFFDYMMQGAKGTKMPRGDKSSIMKYKIKFPKDNEEQKYIANIFSKFDKKIRNNNKINQTLEEMAQAIYKSWFVYFEPFQDKKFNKGKIKEIIEITLGNSPKSDTYNEDGIGLPLLNGASDFNNGRPTSGRYSSKPKRIAKEGGEILLCTRGTIGHVSFADKDYCIGRGVSSMKPQDKIYNEYVYFTVKYYLEKLKREAAGSVIRGLTKSDMLNIPIVKCNKNIFKEFHNLMGPIINKQLTIIKENKTLKELRDTLLPKLMSGEINVLSSK